MAISVPGAKNVIEYVVFDHYGTITVHGAIVTGLSERIDKLRQKIDALYLFSSNAYEDAQVTADQLGLSLRITDSAVKKSSEIIQLGEDKGAVIGNGDDDVYMLEKAILPIAVCQKEGLSVQALGASRVMFNDILAAIDFLLDERRMVDTLGVGSKLICQNDDFSSFCRK